MASSSSTVHSTQIDPTFSSPSPLPPISSANQVLTIKLNSTNYLIWKEKILNIAIANAVEHLLDNSLPTPPEFLDSDSSQQNPEYIVWKRYNRLVISWIFSSLAEDLLPQIVSCKTASKIWDALAHLYASSSLARVTDLKNQLNNLSKDGLSAVQYIQKFTSLFNTLVEIGESVSDRDRLVSFLSGLGSEYNVSQNMF